MMLGLACSHDGHRLHHIPHPHAPLPLMPVVACFMRVFAVRRAPCAVHAGNAGTCTLHVRLHMQPW